MSHLLKNHCLAVLTLAFLLAFAAPVLADDARGTIAMVEPDDHTFTLVDDNNNVLLFRVLVGSSILIDDQEATMWDLQPGDLVTVTFDRDEDQLQATAIECRRTR